MKSDAECVTTDGPIDYGDGPMSSYQVTSDIDLAQPLIGLHCLLVSLQHRCGDLEKGSSFADDRGF